MKDIFLAVLNYFTDGNKKPQHKLIIAFTIIIGIFLANDLTGFSYYFMNKSKLSQIQQINEVLKDTSLTKSMRKDLLSLREEAFYHSPWTLSILKSAPTGLKYDTTKPTAHRNVWWQIFSSSWLLIIVMLYAPFGINTSYKKYKILKNIGYILLIEAVIAVMAVIIALIFSIIPIISNEPIYNYMINFSATFVLIIVIAVVQNMRKIKTPVEKGK